MRDKRGKWERRHTRDDLSRDDLLFLLSILEGELQVGNLFTSRVNNHLVAESSSCETTKSVKLHHNCNCTYHWILELKSVFYCNVFFSH